MKLKNKKVIFIIGLILIGILLIFIGNTSQDNSTKNQTFDYESYTKMLEKKIENFLLSIDGINKVKVIITLDNLNEIYDQNTAKYDYLTTYSSNNENLFATNEVYPSVRGIAIACTNGNNDEVKVKLTNLISAYLGISSFRIEVVGIK